MAKYKGTSDIYRVVQEERKKAKIMQRDINAEIGMQPQSFWNNMKRGSTKIKDIIRVLNFMQLDLFVRNRETGEYHQITNEKN